MISDKGKNLVFLFSLPRSGSTIASLVLGNHSKVCSPPEPWFLLKLSALTKIGNPYSPYDENLATKAAFDFLNEEQFVNAARSFAMTAYNEHLRSSAKSMFVDKTPRYYHILPFIDALFPDAKKIWLKRNPLDVAASYKDAWRIGGDIITGRHFTPASFDFAMGLFNLSSFFDGRRKNCLEVMYEEFTDSPNDTLHAICKFLEIPYEKSMVDINNNPKLISQYKASTFGDKEAANKTTVNSASVGHWRKRLSISEAQALIDLIGTDIFSRMGYPIRADLEKYGVRIPAEESARMTRENLLLKSVHNLESFESIAEERLSELKVKEESLNHLGQQLRGKDKEIDQLASVAHERLLILKKMEGIDLQLEEKELEIFALKAVAEERLLLFKKAEGSDRQLKEKEKEIIDLKAIADERSRTLLEKETEIHSTHNIAAERARELTEKEEQIALFSRIAQDRERELKEKEKLIEEITLEAEKRLAEMQRMVIALQEKESAIAMLQQISEERLGEMLNEEKEISRLLEIDQREKAELEEFERKLGKDNKELRTVMAELAAMKGSWWYKLSKKWDSVFRKRSRSSNTK